MIINYLYMYKIMKKMIFFFKKKVEKIFDYLIYIMYFCFALEGERISALEYNIASRPKNYSTC